mmetsp:Transcript_31898/g.77730  ORF Transcript_31898/g.77730 Transcript_31898/m.77730 type:complete len:584 (-) Transcript_31898:153-1904(-)|eukprot:CAMPEP_0114522520 /NCGR_PEP_ID=MMETSP0109-20121206/20782_1 /TAXON_ID=29199 /ORGANISM="Chlorarachnion reptans, Strain CCCM449" /LENGTH=583 /DNA_ID=CAMNT_0001703735 /DNA_START=249 /DNA_END=2000 /DNA_ORIENTATION=-
MATVQILASLVVIAAAASLSSSTQTLATQSLEKQLSREQSRACIVYCQGEILDAVQRLKIFNDSKTFVDMPMTADPEQILEAFSKLPRPLTKDTVSSFVSTLFLPAGSDVETHIPEDWNAEPGILARLGSNENAKYWARNLNEKWKVLGRRTKDSVRLYPQRTSTLYREKPFVVPGGRFRESYYWDTYWIILGLLECDMLQTAVNMATNLLRDVETFKFVPNGGRLYYTNRTQPPLLTIMVKKIHDYQKSLNERNESKMNIDAFIKYAVPVLDDEYRYWMDETEGHVVNVKMEGNDVKLNRFFSREASPRPESYREDAATIDAGGNCREIRAAAESGWDFSSRWMKKPGNESKYSLTMLRTRDIVPIDLNSFLYQMETELGNLHKSLGDYAKSSYYAAAAAGRKWAIFAGMRDANGSFVDIWASTGDPSPNSISAASFVPMFAGLLDDMDEKAKNEYVVNVVLKSPLLLQGGVSTTVVNSSQQWDFPNAWPPLQHMFVEGLYRLGTQMAKKIADTYSRTWLQSGYKAWKPKGDMFEKYDARHCGVGGGGGEYGVQIGFGWTNGVVLGLLRRHPDVDLNTTECR